MVCFILRAVVIVVFQQRDLAMDIQESELETSAVKTVEGSWPTLVPETTPRSFAAHAQKPVKSQGPMGGFAQSQLGRNGFPSSEVVSPFVQSKDDGHEHSSISRSDVNSLSTEQVNLFERCHSFVFFNFHTHNLSPLMFRVRSITISLRSPNISKMRM